MTGKSYAMLWGKILHSSLWIAGSKEMRLVWITLLAMKNVNGEVFASIPGLAHIARVTNEECKAALDELLAPDPYDTSKVEEGRRIRQIDGGWEIVNHDFYRFTTPEKREEWRLQKELQRLESKIKGMTEVQKRNYLKGVSEVAKPETLTARAARLLGRSDTVAEAIAAANAEAKKHKGTYDDIPTI